MTLSLIFIIVLTALILVSYVTAIYNITNYLIAELIGGGILIILLLMDWNFFDNTIKYTLAMVGQNVIFKPITDNISTSSINLQIGMYGLSLSLAFFLLTLLAIIILRCLRIGSIKSFGNTKKQKTINFTIRTSFLVLNSFILSIFFSQIRYISFLSTGFLESYFSAVENLGVLRYVPRI